MTAFNEKSERNLANEIGAIETQNPTTLKAKSSEETAAAGTSKFSGDLKPSTSDNIADGQMPTSGNEGRDLNSDESSDMTAIKNEPMAEDKNSDSFPTEVKNESGVCLCGSSEESSFMICCDHCGVWYHGACLQVTRSLANKIETYACPPCISKNNGLHIVYRTSKREKMEKSSDCRDEKAKKRKEFESSGSDQRSSSQGGIKDEQEVYDENDRCHNCSNCIRNTNCGKCINCESGLQPCHKRICLQSNYWSKQKKKLPNTASSSSITHSQSKSSAHNNCGVGGKKSRKDRSSMKHGNWSTDDESSKGGSTNSFSTNTTGSQHPAIGGAQKGKRGRKKGWRKGKNEKDSSKDHYASVRAKSGAMNNDIVSYGTDRTFTLDERRHIASATYRACTRRNAPVEKIKEDPKQCFGPGCTKASRFNSKYCSDECGMRLARKRLEMVLPGRVSDFYDQLPNATARSMRLRAALEQRIQQLSNETRILASYRAEVHRWISTITDYEPVEEDDDKGSSDTDFVIHCPVCSVRFPAKQITKHVERCFVRVERQSCFGTQFKSQVNPFNIFCDQYNKANNTFCKRIRVVCSEHYKPGAEAELKICGCPLDIGRRNPGSGTLTFPSVEEILKDSRFCRRPRKDCIQHCNWVQSILGLFDVELMNQVLKLDECFERKRHLQLTESTRGDVISLMTSERIVHEPSTKNTNPEPSSDAAKSITSNDDHSESKAKEIDCGDNDDSKKTADSLNDSEVLPERQQQLGECEMDTSS